MKIQINKICKDHEITQANLARELEVSTRTIQNLQYGKFQVKALTLVRLMTFTGENISSFFEQYVEND